MGGADREVSRAGQSTSAVGDGSLHFLNNRVELRLESVRKS